MLTQKMQLKQHTLAASPKENVMTTMWLTFRRFVFMDYFRSLYCIHGLDSFFFVSSHFLISQRQTMISKSEESKLCRAQNSQVSMIEVWTINNYLVNRSFPSHVPILKPHELPKRKRKNSTTNSTILTWH